MSGLVSCAALARQVRVEDEVLLALGLDPYRSSSWAVAELMPLRGKLDELASGIRRRVSAAHQLADRPWLAPVVERELATDPVYPAIVAWLDLAADACDRGAGLELSAD